MKKIYAVLIALLILVSPLSVLAAQYDPPADVYVADYANVIDSDVENYIIRTGAKLCEKTGAQIVIMTVKFIDGDFEDFCYEIFNDWGIGDAKLNNGILVVMSIGDQDAYCLQGAGLEKSLTSGKISTMMNDYLADDFFSGDYSAGARHIFDAFKDWLCDYYNVSLTDNPTPAPTPGPTPAPGPTTNTGSDIRAIIGFIIFIVLLVLIIRLIFRPRYSNRANYYSSSYTRPRYGRYSRYDRYDNTYHQPNNNNHSSGSSWWGSSNNSSGSSSSSHSSWGSSGSSSSHSSSHSSSSSSHSSSSGSHSSSSHISHSSSSHSSGGSHSSGSFGGGGSRGGGGGFGKH